MAGELLGAAGHREVGAELQRALSERGGEGVVDGDQGATRVRRLDQPPYVAHVEPRVRRRLDPQQLRPVQDVQLGVLAGRRGAHLDAVRLQLRAGQRQRLVAVVGQDGGVAGAQLGEEHRGDRGHARGEDQCLHAGLSRRLQLADGALETGPRRVLVAAVGVRAGRVARQVEVGGEHRPGQGGLVLDGFRAAPARTARVPSPGPEADLSVPALALSFVAESLMPPVLPLARVPRRAVRCSPPPPSQGIPRSRPGPRSTGPGRPGHRPRQRGRTTAAGAPWPRPAPWGRAAAGPCRCPASRATTRSRRENQDCWNCRAVSSRR
ncbi:hypothetical protein STENM327S_03271 [Streptomyces tendae]